jgi:hypothetical protein
MKITVVACREIDDLSEEASRVPSPWVVRLLGNTRERHGLGLRGRRDVGLGVDGVQDGMYRRSDLRCDLGGDFSCRVEEVRSGCCFDL